MILKKHHATYLFVTNVRKSSAWYSKILSAPLIINEESFALIEIGDSELCFHLADTKSPVSTGGSVSYFYVDDLVNAAKVFEEEGAIIYRGPLKIDGTPEGICQIKDPFGNVIGLQGSFK
jgi:predicted enzyme related to lactoylglutathione lyase